MLAPTIHSTHRDESASVRARLAADAVDVLLISPERLSNASFRDALLPLFVGRVGLVVVDEARCISDWGHDSAPTIVGSRSSSTGCRRASPFWARPRRRTIASSPTSPSS